jgi:hypothetical protein
VLPVGHLLKDEIFAIFFFVTVAGVMGIIMQIWSKEMKGNKTTKNNNTERK